MRLKRMVTSALAWVTLWVPFTRAQNFEVTGQVGGQINGGIDLSTPLFHRIDVGNGVNYGVTAGYLLGERSGVEFQWNRNQADTVAEPVGGGPNVKLFTLTTNQYMGHFVFHFADREHRLRPFVMFGLGATSLSPDVSSVNGVTRFAFALGGGAKYNLSPHFGLRAQAKWSPTYITTSDGGVWCDPIWGGCWVIGNDHFLNEFDISGGFTVRF
ncbi:MAG TPA: porin family protein [Terriglobales bacterium]|nr:porin family protein [Terriglobales bacterium]